MIKNNLNNRNKRNLNIIFFTLLLFFLLNIFNPNYLSFATEDLSNQYLLESGDVLQVSVWGYPELTNTITVRPDGMVSFPLIKEIKAMGMTTEELKQEINKQLCEVIKDAQISLIVIHFRTIDISVLGEVNKPGLYPLSGEADVLKAISVASGLTDKAGLKDAIIIRKNEQVIPVDLEKLFIQNDLTQNYLLSTGDSLYIPKAFAITNISIAGEVKSPGLYSLEGKVDILKAISACGGLTPKANLKQVIINKHNNEVIPVDLEKLFLQNDLTQNYPLETGDSLFVPLVLGNNVYVLGEIKNPGLYPIEGECTVVEAISKAGGYTGNARLKSCVVIRKFPGDEEGLKLRTITLKDVKVIREKYEQVIEINLEKILKDGELAQNITLQPQDIIFLPTRPLSEFDIATILDIVTTGLTAYDVLLK
jgi:protein involved in polysaccharide export with SLBB domain